MVMVVLLSAATVQYFLNKHQGRWVEKKTTIWPPAPYQTVPYNCYDSDLVVIGSVKSRNMLEKSEEGIMYYNITLEIKRTLKGSLFQEIVVMIRHKGEPLDWTHRPEIEVGERLLLTLLTKMPDASSHNWYRLGYETSSEYYIWRIEGEKVYNKMSFNLDPSMPVGLKEKWKRSYTLNEFISTVQRSLLDPEEVRREIVQGVE